MEEVGEVIGLLDGATSQQSTNDLYIHSHSITFSIPHKSTRSRTAPLQHGPGSPGILDFLIYNFQF